MEEKNLKTILEVSDLMRRYDQVYSRWAESRGFSTNAMSLMEELHIRPEGMEPEVRDFCTRLESAVSSNTEEKRSPCI